MDDMDNGGEAVNADDDGWLTITYFNEQSNNREVRKIKKMKWKFIL